MVGSGAWTGAARRVAAAATVVAAIGPSSAWAQCTEAYTVDGMVNDLVSVETFLRNVDDANAARAAEELRQGLPCMTEVMPRMIVGRALRAVGSGLVAGGDEATGEDWLRTAAEVEPSFEFGLEDLPESHRVRAVYETARTTTSGEDVAVAGASLPTTATVYLDGKKLLEPKAKIDRFHLVQLDSAGTVQSWVIEGNRFPDAVLVSAAPVAEGKKPKPTKAPKPTEVAATPAPEPTAPKPGKPAPAPKPAPAAAKTPAVNAAPVRIERDRPWEKTPLMIVGGAVAAGGGVLYYLSYVTHKKFESYVPEAPAAGATASNAEDDLRGLYGTTNRLVIASIAVAAVGAGTFTWGAILDGSTVLPAVHVRF